MARELISLQSQAKALGDVQEGTPQSDTKDVCKALIYIVRQIADGIAWRVLQYDRGLIHELAFRQSSGHVELSSVLSELSQAEDHVATYGSPVILNDVTNCMRYGDLTVVTKDKVIISEVKAGKASAKDRRARRQRANLETVVEFINSGERVNEGRVEKLIRVDSSPVSHVPALSDLIKSATTSGRAHARLSDAIAVDVFDTDIACTQGALKPQGFHNPFAQNKWAQTHSNYDTFGIFSPNVAPYSIFPLPDEQRIDLMYGRVLLLTYVNVGELIRALRRRGLHAHLPTEEEMNSLPKGLYPSEFRNHELQVGICVGNNTHSMKASLAHLGRMGCELLDENSLADLFEKDLEQAGGVEEHGYTAFRYEGLLWD
jgi:hypothetical protein